jgi:general secretion pathway protein I
MSADGFQSLQHRVRLSDARSRGFGLLEVLVALAVLAAVGGTLFNWINQSLNSAQRLQRSDAEARLSLNVQSLLASMNPLTEPAGQREIAGMKLSWTSSVVQPVVSGRTFVQGQHGDWQIGLFRVSVDAEDLHSNAGVHLEMLKTGLRRNPGAATAADRNSQ